MKKGKTTRYSAFFILGLLIIASLILGLNSNVSAVKDSKNYENRLVFDHIFNLFKNDKAINLRAEIDADPSSAKILETITFDGSNSKASGWFNYIKDYKWDFGDGSSTSKKRTTITHKIENVYHCYWREGNYVASLTVWDKHGNYNTKTVSIEIYNDKKNEIPTQEMNVLENMVFEYYPILYTHPTSRHNTPISVSDIIDNSFLKIHKNINLDKIIVNNPTSEDLMVYSGDTYYIEEKDPLHLDKDSKPCTYVHIRKDDGYYFIQYWFFYYFNDGSNNHEGDMEMIQISFEKDDSIFIPRYATYSQHTDNFDFNFGEKREWRNVEKYISGENQITNHPLVYVSTGKFFYKNSNSHANYFYKGDNPYSDYTSECTKPCIFSKDEINILPTSSDDLNGYEWLVYGGKWGRSFGDIKYIGSFSGPPGPAHCYIHNEKNGDPNLYNKWLDPFEFEDGRKLDGNHEPIGVYFSYPEITVDNKVILENEELILHANLTYSNGNPLGDKKVYFFVNGSLIGHNITDSTGHVFLECTDNIGLGEYDIYVLYKGQNQGDSYFAWCDNKGILKVISDNPLLSFSPKSHDFNILSEGVIDNFSFEIWNTGDGLLDYELQENCNWLEISPVSGESTGEHDTIEITIDTSGLSNRRYSYDINIISNGGNSVFSVEFEIVTSTQWVIETVDSNNIFDPSISLDIDSNGNPCMAYCCNYGNSILKYAYYSNSNWNIDTVDDSGDTGYYTSLKLDRNNNPHICYMDNVNDDLKYAFYSGDDWNIETVDSEGNVGHWTSLSLDNNDNPHISYKRFYDASNHDLKYAYYSEGSWNIEIVDSGDLESYTSISLDENNKPSISYCKDNDLKYAYYQEGNWNIETVDSEGNCGYFSSLELDSNNRPHISYYDTINDELRYAYYSNSDWNIETVDSEGNCGYSSSLSLDSNNNPHISYRKHNVGSDDQLKYAFYSGDDWNIETVDIGSDLGSRLYMGLDSNNYPSIGFVNADENKIMCARKI